MLFISKVKNIIYIYTKHLLIYNKKILYNLFFGKEKIYSL